MTAHLSFGIKRITRQRRISLQPRPWRFFYSCTSGAQSCTKQAEKQNSSCKSLVTKIISLRCKIFSPCFVFFSLSSQIESKQAKVNKKGGMFEKLGVKISQQLSDQAVFGSSVSILHLLQLLFLLSLSAMLSKNECTRPEKECPV